MADTPAGAPIGETPAAPVAEVVVPEVIAPETPATETPAPETPATDPPAPEAEVEEPAVKEGDWAAIRERIAKGDEKLAKRLARYSSVDSVVEALIAAQAKISDGSLKSTLAKDATPEQVAAWREENGIPASAEEYEITLDEGLILGEEDRELVDSFIGQAHTKNMTPEQVNASVNWYLAMQEQQAEEQANEDLTAKEEGLAALNEAWGSEAPLNKSLIKNLIATAPGGEDTSNLILGARLADGTPLASNPNVLRWLADVARTVNPTATVVPGSGNNASQAIETEMAELTKLMGDSDSAYWKGPQALKMQERFRQLADVKSKMGA
jgi:hypothetical protein